MTFADQVRSYWCAAYLIRRAPDRNLGSARAILQQVAKSSTGRVHDNAKALLKEIDVQHSNDAG